MLNNTSSATRPPPVHYQSPSPPLSSSSMCLMKSSFSYRKLKKLPSSHLEHDQQQRPPPPATSIHSYYRALARRRRRAWGRRRGGRPRLRILSLARALRRKAAAVVGRVRASVVKVAARLREGRPYIGDLFAGNYMFMQVTPSPTMAASDNGFAAGAAAARCSWI